MWKRHEASQIQALQQLMINLQRHFEIVNSLVKSACKSAYVSKPQSLLQQAQQANLEANTKKILESRFFDDLRSNHRVQENLAYDEDAHKEVQHVAHETARHAQVIAIRAVYAALNLVQYSIDALLQRMQQRLGRHMNIADLDTHEKELQEKHDEKKKRKMVKKLMKMHAGQGAHVTQSVYNGFQGFPMHAIPQGVIPHGSVPHGTPQVVPMQGVPMWVPQHGLMHSPTLPGVQGMHANVAHGMYMPAGPHISPISPIPQTLYML